AFIRQDLHEECAPQAKPVFPAGTWQPYDIAFDERGRAFISDFANGLVLRFDRNGRFQTAWGGLNQPTHLAIDRRGYVYVIHANNTELAIFDADGNRLNKLEEQIANRPDKVEAYFSAPDFRTDRQGNLYLADLCDPPPVRPSEIAFDLRGNQLQVSRLTPVELQALQFPRVLFPDEGVYISTPLDSEIYRCLWHRVVIEGDLPKGSSVRVDTLTTEIEYDTEDLENQPETAWRTGQL